jgi:predicted secreted protein
MNAQQLEIKIGSSVLIKLESLTGAGYIWDYSIDNSSVIELKKKDNELQMPRTAGHSGMEVFEITGLKKGTANISFNQSRKWEQDKSAIKSRCYDIKVE